MEKELLYVKDTLQHVYSRLSVIYEYLALSDVVWEISKIKEEQTLQSNEDKAINSRVKIGYFQQD